MTKHKSDIKKYSPSLGGTKYNEPILKLLALVGPTTSPRLVNEVLNLAVRGIIKIKKYPNLETPANRYYAKKKLNTTIDKRLHNLQGDPKNPRYVEAETVKKGKRSINKWALTFRGYILSLVAMEEVRRKWRVCFKHYRNKTPSGWREIHDKLIEHNVTNNLYNVLFAKTLQDALKGGELDIIDSAEIVSRGVEVLMIAFNEALELLVSGRRPPVSKVRFGKLKIGRFANLNREDRESFFRVARDPVVKENLMEATNDIIKIQRKKVTLYEEIFSRFKDV